MKNEMFHVQHDLKIGDKLYWSDSPDTLAGIIVRFTPKRDVIINFVSGKETGEHSYPIKLTIKFIRKP